jgi:hypothetical protein
MKLHFKKYAKTAMNHFNLGKILDNCDNIIQSKVTLDFKNRIEDMIIKVDWLKPHYNYFRSDDSIMYIDVKYKHPKLQSLIECNPTVWKILIHILETYSFFNLLKDLLILFRR